MLERRVEIERTRHTCAMISPMWKQGKLARNYNCITHESQTIWQWFFRGPSTFYSRLNHDKHSICPQNKFHSEQGVSRTTVQRNPAKLFSVPFYPFFLFFFPISVPGTLTWEWKRVEWEANSLSIYFWIRCWLLDRLLDVLIIKCFSYKLI